MNSRTTLSLLVLVLVLVLLEDPARAVSEMKRVTRPGDTVDACTWGVDWWERRG